MDQYPKVLDQLFCASCGYGADGARMQMPLQCTLEERIHESTWDSRYALCKKMLDSQMNEEEIAYLQELYEEIRRAVVPQIDKEALLTIVKRYRNDKGFEGSQLEAALTDSAEEHERGEANKISPRCIIEFLFVLRKLFEEKWEEEERL